MTPPSLEVAREILADTAAKARASGDSVNEIAAAAIDVVLARLATDSAEITACSSAAGGDRGSDERLSEYIARIRRVPRTVPFMDERGNRIGDAVVDGCQIVARVTDKEAAALFHATTGPRGVSVGYRVEVKPEPEPATSGAPHDFKSEPAHKLGPEAVAVSVLQRASLPCGMAFLHRDRPCGATPTVGGNGNYRYCEPHMQQLEAAGRVGVARDAALVAEMLPCPFCGKRVLLGVEMAPVSGCPAVWCRDCGAWGPPGRGNAEDVGEAIAHWNRRKPVTVRPGGGVEVRTREQAVALFGRGTALADTPLPFVMVDGTAIAEPAPGAPRVLCGLPVDGCTGSCCLAYGHQNACETDQQARWRSGERARAEP